MGCIMAGDVDDDGRATPHCRARFGLGGNWRVIVRNDNHNTFEHVAQTLARVLPGVSLDQGHQIADRIHNSGQAIVWRARGSRPSTTGQQLEAAGLTMAPLERAEGTRGSALLAAALLPRWPLALRREAAAPTGSAERLPGPRRSTDLKQPTAFRFAPDGRVFVAQKSGRILVFDSIADTTPTVFADLRTDVYDTGDRGLLGLEVDPEFPARALRLRPLHLRPRPRRIPRPPSEMGRARTRRRRLPRAERRRVDACPVSGRLVRLTDERRTRRPTARQAEKSLVEGWCQQYSSHSVGDLGFGPEGALYASGGEGASFTSPTTASSAGRRRTSAATLRRGGSADAAERRRWLAALAGPPHPGRPDRLNGTVIRIDPDTGEGLPGNPIAAQPRRQRAAHHRLRLPQPLPLRDRPDDGEIYVDNVGSEHYEEIDRFPTRPPTRLQLGLALLRGAGPQPQLQGLGLDPLRRALRERRARPRQPFFYYRHGSRGPRRRMPDRQRLGDLRASPSTAATSFPAAYEGALFFADSVRGCIYVMSPAPTANPIPATATRSSARAGSTPASTSRSGPTATSTTSNLFGDEAGGAIHRISYNPGAPVARLSADHAGAPRR